MPKLKRPAWPEGSELREESAKATTFDVPALEVRKDLSSLLQSHMGNDTDYPGHSLPTLVVVGSEPSQKSFFIKYSGVNLKSQP